MKYPRRIRSRAQFIVISIIMMGLATLFAYKFMHAEGTMQYVAGGAFVGSVYAMTRDIFARREYLRAVRMGALID